MLREAGWVTVTLTGGAPHRRRVRLLAARIAAHVALRCVVPRLPPTPPTAAQIETARGRALADAYGAQFYETSAKDGTGVRDAFHAVAAAAVANLPAEGGGGGGQPAGAVKQLKGGAGGGKDGGGAGGGKDGAAGGKDGKDCVLM